MKMQVQSLKKCLNNLFFLLKMFTLEQAGTNKLKLFMILD